MTLREPSASLAESRRVPYIGHMKKTTQPDLPLILSDYEQFVIQQERRRQQVRDWYAKWEETRPQGQFGTWHISDRH